jgi:hypothetical protein
MKRPIVLLILTLLLITTASAAERSEVRIAMRDGVELAADVYRPTVNGTYPAILLRTPYGKGDNRLYGEKLAAAGYAVVIQDVRGKFASGGTFVPFLREEQDGLDTLDWIAKAPWSNGRIGAFGPSYSGFAALVLARHGHPSLKAAFSASGWVSTARVNAPGGALHMMVGVPWLLFAGGETRRSLSDFDLDALFRHLPLRDAFDAAGVHVPAWKDRRVLRANVNPDYSKTAVPVFHLTGWYDFTAAESLETFRRMRQATERPQRLVVGPWVHGQIHLRDTKVGDLDAGAESLLGTERFIELAIGWFDCQLRDRCTPEPPVRVFVLGENRWRDFDAWPPRESRRQTFYLDSDRRLSAKPRRGAGSDRFRFDPADPVPTLGGANFHFFPEVNGPRDQRPLDARRDIVRYTTAPLTSDIVIAGPIRAVLHVSTEGRDADFTVRLIDVVPDGRAIGIADGIVRLAHRGGGDKREPVEPGRVYEVAIELGDLAMRIAKGDRLRLDISSSNFPKFDRNPNTGEDPFEAKVLEPALQTIHHAAARPSRVEITLLHRPGEYRRPANTSAMSSAPEAKADGDSLEVLEQAVARAPKRAEAHFRLGAALMEKLQSAGMPDKVLLSGKARRALEQAVELDPAHVEARTALARYYLNAPMIAGGSIKKAQEQAQAIVALDPAKGHLLMARIHKERKEWDGAVAAYMRALEHEPKNAAIRYDLGLAYQELQRWPEAARTFEETIAIDADFALAWYQLGRTGALSGANLDRALTVIDVYIARFSAAASATFQVGAWWRKGMILEKLGRTADAAAAYRRATELDPSHEEAKAALARINR